MRGRRQGCLESFCQAACRATGLDDFGDPYYRTGLRVLLRALRRDVRLTLIGHMLLRRSVSLALEQRLLIQEARKAQPELFAAPLLPPLVITGMPRCGTTFLHRLLAVDETMRAPILRELVEPVAREPGVSHSLRDLRLKTELAVMRHLNRELDARHFIRSDAPEECMFALAVTFRTILPWTLAPVHAFLAWYMHADRRQKYREYRDILALLQRRDPGRRLLLKAPDHLGSLSELIAAVPEALIVVCRRDPAIALTSFNSLIDGLHRVTAHDTDRVRLGQASLSFYAAETERYVAARRTWPDHILEVDYENLTRRPLDVVSDIYRRLGLPVGAGLEERLWAFIAGNPKDKHGRHVYSAADFGQTADEIRQRLGHFC
ncbi:sulfotransferase [Nordella sp. HKS 07]|uniref:sulfotransferase family protein n=1 Tax=Nordella sp. HKS 07 TaxID=2712222 RepID=UPI0013E1A6A7|nr:sulfotransferase [Nordella sp. HKS 07]QIG49248.1 sulfotransferase [Nordella sp. HKS 07]